MSYNHAESATLNAAASNYVIASDAYVANPDYKILTMSGAGVIYSGMTVISGGTAQLAASAVLADTTIGAGGSLTREGELFLSNVTFESGAIGSATYLSGCTLNTGAKVTVPGGLVIAGIGNSIAQNTLVGGPGNIGNLYTVNGVIYGINNVGGAITFADGIIVSGGNVGGYKYFTRGAQGRDLTANTTNNGPGLGDGGYLYNVKVTNGSVYVNENTLTSAPSISLGGAETVIPVGHFEVGTATLGKVINAIYAEGGKLYGVDLHTGRYTDATRPYYWMDKLTILEGLIIDSPVVSSGGSLTIGSGGSGEGITVNANGNLYAVNGGKATNVTMTGGWLTVDANGEVNGANINAANATAAAPIMIKQGKLIGYNISAGVISGYSGSLLSGGTIFGGQVLLRDEKGGALLRDVTVRANHAIVQTSGNSVADAKVSGGALYVQYGASGTGIDVFTGGTLYVNGSNGGINVASASGIRISGGTFQMGQAAWQLGASAADVTMYSGSINAAYEAALTDVTVSGGTFNLSGGATANTVRVEQKNALLNVKSATVNGLVVNNSTAGVICKLYEGAVVNDLTATGMGIGTTVLEAYGNVTMSKITLSNGNIWYYGSNIKGYDLTLRNGQFIVQSDGGYLSGAIVSAGHLYARAEVEDVTMVGGNAIVDNAAGYLHNVTVSTGNVSMTAANARIADLTIIGGAVSAYNGTVSNFVVSGGNISGANTAVLSGGTVTGTGQVLLRGANGGTVARDLTILKNLAIVQASGNFATDVKVSGGIFYIQAGASGTNIDVFSGGRFEINNASGADIKVYNGGEFYLNSHTNYTYGSASDVTVYGGTMQTRVGTVTGVTQSGGAINALSGTVLSSYVLSAGYLSAFSGAVISGGIINGGEIRLRDENGGAVLRNVTVLNKSAIVQTSGNSVADAKVSGGALYVQYGASGTGIDVFTGGTLYVNGSNGGINVASASGIRISGGTFQMGQASWQSGGSVADVTMYAGTINAKYNAQLNGVTLNDGTMNLDNNAVATVTTGASDAIINLATGGTLNFVSGAVAYNVNAIETAYVNVSNATVYNITASAATTHRGIQVKSGGVISGLTLSGGKTGDLYTVALSSGGAVHHVVHNKGGIWGYGGSLYDLSQAAGEAVMDSASYLSGAKISGGYLYIWKGTTAENVYMNGGTLNFSSGTLRDATLAVGFTFGADDCLLESATLLNATVTANSNATLNSVTVGNNATLNISGGAVVTDLAAQNGGTVNVALNNTVNNAQTVAGAKVNFVDNKSAAVIAGADTNIAASTFYYNGATVGLGFSVANGVIRNLGADGNLYRIAIGDGITVEDAEVQANCRISAFGGAVVSGVNIVATTTSASVIMRDDSEVYNATLSGGTYKAVINVYENAKADGVTINAGGKVGVSAATASIDNTTIKAGGQLVLIANADTGRKLTLAFDGAEATMDVDLSKLAGSTTVYATGVETVGTYTLGTGSCNGVTQKWGLYENALVNGGTYDDALNGVTYSFNGTALTTTALSIATGAAAGLSGDNYTALRTNDRAAKWTSGAGTTLVTENFSGDAWVEVAGDLTGALYGAAVDFANTVNINATSGTIRNLAAGAETGKTVGAVKLTFDGADLAGAGYAGGFGNVTNETETLITTGSFAKDFYAGALANKLTSTTSVGDVSMTINGGTFSGNIYGASAVKTDTTKGNGTRHTAGDVTLTVTSGTSTKGTQACIFAGGYATGDATGTVYTVDSVTATISGGSWGEAAGGRGIFGGIMASGVTAEVLGDVNLTISGDATMGNVYGGGWAQKTNGKSIVGDVNLTISGGTITNVFGGGSHSTSGGTTETGDITITVSGGNITGAIYARGQLEGDTTGAASVIFTGANDFDCSVFGYSYVGGAGEGAALSFSGYTGTFSGNVGGFDSVTFADGTAMTLSTEAGNVSNGAWEFDLTDRANTLAGTSLLTWSDADFTGDSIKVSFADDAQAQGGWNIATVAEAFSGTTFDVEIGGAEIVSGLAYNQQIAAGDYAGWGFELESGVLKFKQLA